MLIALAVVGLVAVGSFVGRTEPKSSDTFVGQSDRAGGEPTPQFASDAESLVSEFKVDESAAERKYKDKWIEITGVVNEVDSNLRIGGGTNAETATVNCHDIPADRLSDASKGDDVLVVGKFKENGDEGLDFERCRLLQVDGSS